MSQTNRIVSIDFLRAFCMLYIVGFWHLMNYTNPILNYANIYSNFVTEIVLGLFVFISGFLLGTKTFTPTKYFYIVFLCKRLFRIYPLYFFSLLFFFFFNISDGKTLIKAALLLSMIWGPSPPTLWFITMIMSFYLIAPFLIKASSSSNKYFVICVCCASLILTWGFVFQNRVDYRIVLFFPAFSSGIFLAKSKNVKTVFYLLFYMSIFILFFLFAVFDRDSKEFDSIIQMPMVVATAIIIFLSFERFFSKLTSNPIITAISYASYAMFLFHRPVFMAVQKIFFPGNIYWQICYLALIGLPIIFFISFCMQTIADRIFTSTPILPQFYQA